MFVKHNFDISAAEKEIALSARKSYDLYHYLLLLLVDVHHAATVRNDISMSRLGDTRGAEVVADRFIDNRFINQLAKNDALQTYANEEKLTWAEHQDFVKSILNDILQSEYYKSYIDADGSDYDADKELWRKVVRKELTDNEELYAVVEEDNIYWVNGLDLIIEFVIKTIKQFDEERGDGQELLPMFDPAKGEGLKYATDLIDDVVLNSEKTDDQIEKHLKNWELNRIPTMDMVILKCAISELDSNEKTPANIVINEYVEIAKFFSSPKSAKFINGVLDRMASERKENPFG